MKKSNSHKGKRTALRPNERFLGWTAVFELAVLLLCTNLSNGFLRRG